MDSQDGGEMSLKVCVRNLEFRDKKEALLQAMLPRQMYTRMVLSKSVLESCRSANSIYLNEEDEILPYEVMWVMRVCEP